MSTHRDQLPQLGGDVFLTDGGIETTLIFLEGFQLPCFAAFDLMKTQYGRDALRNYYEPYIDIARAAGYGFILESPTWRANTDWGNKLGYTASDLARANKNAIELMTQLRDTCLFEHAPMVISGCVGPRGDGYDPGIEMSPDEAEEYHSTQVRVLAWAGVDMVTAATVTNSNEAIGITRAAHSASVPVAIGFTVETDGRLPTGESLTQAIEAVDVATGSTPVYFMINCAHPTHFASVLNSQDAALERIHGLRANASARSHRELNDSRELDAGVPEELGRQYSQMVSDHPQINVLGGCCGTDQRHIRCIAHAVAALRKKTT
ncbi:MAG TPA: homocysteine S-methyltransferase family protein [Candidatus Binatus sp.]|nr:homocysteine S-methyltransferase family protein [Candidatus Binatus sp.]